MRKDTLSYYQDLTPLLNLENEVSSNEKVDDMNFSRSVPSSDKQNIPTSRHKRLEAILAEAADLSKVKSLLLRFKLTNTYITDMQ